VITLATNTPFKPIEEAIGWLLAVFYHFIPSLGIAIILLTCAVMLALAPLTAKQARSMIKMQQLQPEIKRIQARNKDDRQKANEEIMRFYQEQKINPLSGCLPLVMQMPIFIALLSVLRHLPANLPQTGTFDNLYVDFTHHVHRAHYFLGMNLQTSPASSTGSLLERLPYYVFVGLIIVTGYVQTKQTMARQSKSQQAAPANAQMQMVGKVMPVIFGFISLRFAAGVNVYFLTSNLWRVAQQQLVLNRIYDEEHAKGRAREAEKDKSGGVVETTARDVDESEPPGENGDGGSRSTNPNTSRRKRKRRKR
jgi:YidC/Oxa1 family membrane protein insertase